MTDHASENSSAFLLRVKLSAAWTSVMCLYAYGDLLGFYDQTLIESILAGNMPMFGPITPQLRLGIAVMMSVPSLMIFISIVAKSSIAQWANVINGALFTLIILSTLIMSPPIYYMYFSLLEMMLTVYISWTAIKWWRQKIVP